MTYLGITLMDDFFTVVSHGRGGAERLRPVRPDSPLVVTVLYSHARFRLV